LFRGPPTPALSFLYYPRVFFMSARAGYPDGVLWMGGMAATSYADLINTPESWNAGPPMPIPIGDTLLEEATAVLMPAISPTYRDVILSMGGMETTAQPQHGGTGGITDGSYLLFTRVTLAVWQSTPLPMIHRRKFANSVILPDASVVVVGGGQLVGHGVPGGEVFETEVFWNGTWKRWSDQASPRTYHSLALLLSDGRLLSAGGNTSFDEMEYETFVPPYLQGAPLRPKVLDGASGSPPTVIHYGQHELFATSVPFGQSIDRVVLMAPGSVTHSQDPNQRYESLAFEVYDDGTMTVWSPANATLAPPGWYLMFLISSAGVPSEAHWVQLMP
jgi:hypothetical protein